MVRILSFWRSSTFCCIAAPVVIKPSTAHHHNISLASAMARAFERGILSEMAADAQHRRDTSNPRAANGAHLGKRLLPASDIIAASCIACFQL
jgi:hypothetical protein